MQAQIQGDQLRVSGKKRDDLQAVSSCCAAPTSTSPCSSTTTADLPASRRPSVGWWLRQRRGRGGVSWAARSRGAPGRGATALCATHARLAALGGGRATVSPGGRGQRLQPAMRSAIGGWVENSFASPPPRNGLAIIRWHGATSRSSGGSGRACVPRCELAQRAGQRERVAGAARRRPRPPRTPGCG